MESKLQFSEQRVMFPPSKALSPTPTRTVLDLFSHSEAAGGL